MLPGFCIDFRYLSSMRHFHRSLTYSGDIHRSSNFYGIWKSVSGWVNNFPACPSPSSKSKRNGNEQGERAEEENAGGDRGTQQDEGVLSPHDLRGDARPRRLLRLHQGECRSAVRPRHRMPSLVRDLTTVSYRHLILNHKIPLKFFSQRNVCFITTAVT